MKIGLLCSVSFQSMVSWLHRNGQDGGRSPDSRACTPCCSQEAGTENGKEASAQAIASEITLPTSLT